MNDKHRRCAFHTLGCKLNFSETSDMCRRLTMIGFDCVDFDDAADVYVINTCTVTEEANKKCRQMIGRCLRRNIDAAVVVTGCYAQLQADKVAAMPGVALVLGNNYKDIIAEEVSRGLDPANPRVITSDIVHDHRFCGSFSVGDRTRSFLKIQDGCDYFCTYCTIPMARGLSRSGTIADTVDLAQKAAKRGAREIVLTGVNLGDFGRRNGETFLGLIEELEKVEGVERYRISSIEPNLLTDEIIAHTAQSRKFMPHFHIPLQSGSDEMLRLMHRRYDTGLYADKITSIKSVMPHAFIGVDVIVGVNGETEALFEQTRAFLASVDFTQLHVFTYSERPGTQALKITPTVDVCERHRRNAILHNLSEYHREKFYRRHIGSRAHVLVESSRHDGIHTGFTENYIRVEVEAKEIEENSIVEVELCDMTADGTALVGKA